MLRSQAALCGSPGSLEMSVFQTLSAGKMGQLASTAGLLRAWPALARPVLAWFGLASLADADGGRPGGDPWLRWLASGSDAGRS